jgi:hypothetical protein
MKILSATLKPYEATQKSSAGNSNNGCGNGGGSCVVAPATVAADLSVPLCTTPWHIAYLMTQTRVAIRLNDYARAIYFLYQQVYRFMN